MEDYFKLIKKLANLDRCHCGPEMEKAYQDLKKFYPSCRLIKHNCGDEINYWKIPPFWTCKKATLKTLKGEIIADKSRNNLELFSYSPSFSGKVKLDKLQKHLLSDPARPDRVVFHFRNQYRHWNTEWGFSIADNVRRNLSDEEYEVEIESSFSNDHQMVQADYLHKGKLKKEYLLIGHFDHPSMVNDGLAGSIAAFEVINRLKNKKTKFSYRAFASVEIVGSVAYLESQKDIRKNFQESLFLGFSGINSPLVYQKSFYESSKIDQIIHHLFKFEKFDHKIFNHREIAGNDENIFDSVGYEIPSSTLLRSPFEDYHTDKDNINITSKEKIEEMISFVNKIIHVLENNKIVKSNFTGVPALSNPELDLYLGPENISNIKNSSDKNNFNNDNEIDLYNNYLNENPNLLYHFMNNSIRMCDGKNTILDICNKSKIPYFFAK